MERLMGLVTAEAGRVVNTNGGVVHFTAIAWAGESGAPAPGSLDGPREVAFASGACLAVPRETWKRAGGYPEHYFMYHEDVDLSLRLRLAGGRLGIEPSAVVDHEYEFAKGPAKWQRLTSGTAGRPSCAATRRTCSRCSHPACWRRRSALLVIAAAGGWAPQKARATAGTLGDLRRLVGERRAIQRTRTISSAEFARWLTAELRSPFLGRAARSPLLAAALRGYWAIVRRLLALRG